MSRYCAIGEIIESTHPRLKVGNLMAVPLSKKWKDPYTIFFRVESEGNTMTLAHVKLRWIEIKTFPPGLTDEEKSQLMNIWLERVIKERAKTLSLMKWLAPKRQETAITIFDEVGGKEWPATIRVKGGF